jgi:hypothetical protein
MQSIAFFCHRPCGSVGVGKNRFFGRGEFFGRRSELWRRSRCFRERRRLWLDELDIFEAS